MTTTSPLVRLTRLLKNITEADITNWNAGGHTHTNKEVLDLLSSSDGVLRFNGQPISGETVAPEPIDYAGVSKIGEIVNIVTVAEEASVVPIGIPEYNPSVNVLEVYYDNIILYKETDYIINGDSIEMQNFVIPSGNKLAFRVVYVQESLDAETLHQKELAAPTPEDDGKVLVYDATTDRYGWAAAGGEGGDSTELEQRVITVEDELKLNQEETPVFVNTSVDDFKSINNNAYGGIHIKPKIDIVLTGIAFKSYYSEVKTFYIFDNNGNEVYSQSIASAIKSLEKNEISIPQTLNSGIEYFIVVYEKTTYGRIYYEADTDTITSISEIEVLGGVFNNYSPTGSGTKALVMQLWISDESIPQTVNKNKLAIADHDKRLNIVEQEIASGDIGNARWIQDIPVEVTEDTLQDGYVLAYNAAEGKFILKKSSGREGGEAVGVIQAVHDLNLDGPHKAFSGASINVYHSINAVINELVISEGGI